MDIHESHIEFAVEKTYSDNGVGNRYLLGLEGAMKKTDKVLIGIVSGIILLVVVAFAVAMLRPQQAYLPENMPEGVAFNYLLALQQGDYERAYRYLSPQIWGYPRSADKFTENIHNNTWSFSTLNSDAITVEVDSVKSQGSYAEVEMKQTRFNENGLFNSSQRTNFFTIILQRSQDGIWRIQHSESYWLACWEKYNGCK